MALVKDTNSYCTVAEADAYFVGRLDVAAWTAASPEQKEQALITATSILDSLSWQGTVISTNQSLMFPRIGYYSDPSQGVGVDMAIVPRRVVQATLELAYHLLNNDGLLDDTGGAGNLTIGNISLSGIKAASKMPSHVKRIIKPMRLIGRSWW